MESMISTTLFLLYCNIRNNFRLFLIFFRIIKEKYLRDAQIKLTEYNSVYNIMRVKDYNRIM
jgi:hypothetical protein